MAVLCFDLRNADFEGGTVVLLGTGWPCSASTSEILEKHCGTVVLPGMGASSGLVFAGLCCFWCFYILVFGMYLGVMWVT